MNKIIRIPGQLPKILDTENGTFYVYVGAEMRPFVGKLARVTVLLDDGTEVSEDEFEAGSHGHRRTEAERVW